MGEKTSPRGKGTPKTKTKGRGGAGAGAGVAGNTTPTFSAASNNSHGEREPTAQSSPSNIINYFYVALSCFIVFFVFLNLSMHASIDEHMGRGPSADPALKSLHAARNFVIEEYTMEKKIVLDELSYLGHEFVKELDELRDSGLGGEDPLDVGFVPPSERNGGKGHQDILDKEKERLEAQAHAQATGADQAIADEAHKGTGPGTEGGGILREPTRKPISVENLSSSSSSSGSRSGATKLVVDPVPHAPAPPSAASKHQSHAASGAQQQAYARTVVDKVSRQGSGAGSGSYAAALEATRQASHLSNRDDISEYVDAGGKLPILLLTCNRAKLLELTLDSLFAVRGVSKNNVVVIQDGRQADVQNVVESHGLKLIQNSPKLRGNPDGAARIAMHYKFALSKAFDEFPHAPGIIIVEDDLLFSPDFLEYFHSVGPVLDVDDTAFVISAWNDNGYRGRVDDPFALARTEYFPGLGWLMSRKLYKGELEAKWPTQHWDHWLRSVEINRGREIIHPQVPRTYHNGIKGTFMDLNTHLKYFKNIAYNQDRKVSWNPVTATGSGGGGGGILPYSIGLSTAQKKDEQALRSLTLVPVPGADLSTPVPVYAQAVLSVYEERVHNLIAGCTHLRAVEDLATSLPVELGDAAPTNEHDQKLQDSVVLCAWLNVDPEPPFGSPPFQGISTLFGLWHEHRRGAHKGLHEFYWEGKYILLLNTFQPATPAQGHGGTHGAHGRAKGTRSAGTGGDGAAAGHTGANKFSYSTYASLKPADVPVLPARSFNQQLVQAISLKKRHNVLQETGALIVPASKAGLSCSEVCSAATAHGATAAGGDAGPGVPGKGGLTCRADLMYLANTCAAMKHAFGCSAGCSDWEAGFGPEQPAFVVSTAPEPLHKPNSCAVSSNVAGSTCEARHDMTQRLCVCAPATEA
jgi:hypothetical protein